VGEGKEIDFFTPTMFNALLHGIMLALIWLKLVGILSTTKSIGPLLRMILLMGIDMMKFLAIFFALILAAASVFTALFESSTKNGNMAEFGLTFRTLFSSSLGGFNVENYDDRTDLGHALTAVYLIFSNVLLLNLLIAILTNVYEELIERVDSEYRSVLISFYNKFKWDNRYGLFILLPSPITWVVALISPILITTKKPEL